MELGQKAALGGEEREVAAPQLLLAQPPRSAGEPERFAGLTGRA